MNSPPARNRVLVVTLTFPPDGAVGSLRTLRLLKHLDATGSDVEVLTLAPSSYRAGTILDPARLSQVPVGAHVVHVRALRPFAGLTAALRGARRQPAMVSAPRDGSSVRGTAGSTGGGPMRLRRALSAALTLPDAEAGWILPAIARGARRLSARPDVIYSSGPPFSAHVVGGALSTLLKTPWVADFRDPWARAPWREDRFAFEKAAWALLERLIVRRADAVLFVTRANRDDFAAQYGEPMAARFHVVPNGCDTTDFIGLVAGSTRERFTLLHAGSLYGARDPSPLFRAVAEAVASGAIDPGRLRIRLIGRVGIAGVDLPALVRDLGLDDIVEFVPHMPRAQVLQEMVDASALLVVQPVTKLSVPGKLYEYLAAGRPILALAEPDGDTAVVLRGSPAAIVASPSDHAGLIRAITGMIAQGARRVESDPDLYDGARRAAEIAAILHMAASRKAITGSAPADAVTEPTKRS